MSDSHHTPQHSMIAWLADRSPGILYSGTTSMLDGTLSGNTIANNGSNAAFGRGNFAISDGATLRYTGPTAPTNRTIGFANDGGRIDIAEPETTLTWSGVISGPSRLSKFGSGTLRLTGNNNYAGGTRVSNGTLTIDGGGLLGEGAVTVDGGELRATNDSIVRTGAIQIGGTTTTIHQSFVWRRREASRRGKKEDQPIGLIKSPVLHYQEEFL